MVCFARTGSCNTLETKYVTLSSTEYFSFEQKASTNPRSEKEEPKTCLHELQLTPPLAA